MSRLTPDREILFFPCSADHVQDWQPYAVDPYSCYMCDHTYHTCRRPDSHTYFFVCFFLFCLFGYVAFSEYFFVPFPLSLCMESTSYVLSFRMVFFVFFYLVTTGWIFDISLCHNSINSIKIKCFGEGGLQKVQTQGRKWYHDIEFEEKK